MSARALNPDYVAGIKAVLKDAPYFELLSMELEELAPGRAVFRIPAQTKHLNPFERAHGGVAASIIDAATFWAVYTEVDEDSTMTTAELKVNYLAPIPAGQTLLAKAEAIKVGRILGLAEARLIEAESDRLVAFGTATCVILKAPLPQKLASLPPKFLPAK